jgi:hypothetical protein
MLIPVGVAGGCAVTPVTPAADGGPDPLCAGSMPQVSFQRDVVPLVGCSGEACHQAWTYATLVGRQSNACCDHRPIVEPGRPSVSHLVQAITNVDSCVGQMGDLNDAQVAVVIAWICENAPNN